MEIFGAIRMVAVAVSSVALGSAALADRIVCRHAAEGRLGWGYTLSGDARSITLELEDPVEVQRIAKSIGVDMDQPTTLRVNANRGRNPLRCQANIAAESRSGSSADCTFRAGQQDYEVEFESASERISADVPYGTVTAVVPRGSPEISRRLRVTLRSLDNEELVEYQREFLPDECRVESF